MDRGITDMPQGSGHTLEPTRTVTSTIVTTVHDLRREPTRPADIRIDRRAKFGNEFVGRDGSRADVIEQFEAPNVLASSIQDHAVRLSSYRPSMSAGKRIHYPRSRFPPRRSAHACTEPHFIISMSPVGLLW
jgi:hypothetical protein